MVQSILWLVRRAALRFSISLVIFGAIAGAGRAANEPFPGASGKWRAYQSAHFELYSRGAERAARLMLQDLEAVRGFFVQYFELPVRDTPPVTIYLFGSPRDFRAYTATATTGDYELLGEYRSYYDRDVIALSDDWGQDTAAWIVFSNYTKHLLNAASSQPASAVRQGLSMLFGTVKVRGPQLELGDADRFRRELATKHPVSDLRQLLTLEEGRALRPDQEQTNVFHAQAWAFFHYLYLGTSGVPRADANRFLHFLLLDREVDDPARFDEMIRATFQADLPEVTRRFQNYARGSRFFAQRLPIPAESAQVAVAVRAVEPAEMVERLAELALRSKREAGAKLPLLDALRGPRAARAAEALGDSAAHEQDDRSAQEYWQRALDAGSTNPVVLRLVTDLEFARWFSSFDFYFRLPAERADALRALLQRNLTAAPHRLSTYTKQAWVEATAPSPDLGIINQVQRRFGELPEPASTLLALALVRVRLKDDAGALQLLEKLEQFRPTRRERNWADQVQRILRARAPAAPEAAPPTSGGV